MNTFCTVRATNSSDNMTSVSVTAQFKLIPFKTRLPRGPAQKKLPHSTLLGCETFRHIGKHLGSFTLTNDLLSQTNSNLINPVNGYSPSQTNRAPQETYRAMKKLIRVYSLVRRPARLKYIIAIAIRYWRRKLVLIAVILDCNHLGVGRQDKVLEGNQSCSYWNNWTQKCSPSWGGRWNGQEKHSILKCR